MKARPRSEYREDMGDALWWRFPVVEPPFVGSPLSRGQEVMIFARTENGWSQACASVLVGGWPGYHTHFTPIESPDEPEPRR